MDRRSVPAWLAIALVSAACEPRSCKRKDPKDASTKTTDPFGGPGAGFTAQCSGWFPDWIASNPPPAGTPSFQLSQGYPLGVPVLEVTPDDKLVISRWDPFPPSTSTTESPWLAHDFRVAAERAAYLDALKNYVLEGMVEVDFDAGHNTHRSWYHVPMMTTDPFRRREPYHGTTKERALRPDDHKWIVDGAGNSLNSFAIGYYNWLGGYTIGQVFGNADPALADPTKARFIPGALVFKVLFAQYDPTKIDPALDPLIDAPEWLVQDVQQPTAPLTRVRLLQLDVAVRDDRSAQSGWVFATFVYDKSMTAESSPWRRLRAVGLQWGNDTDVTAAGVGAIDESWLAPGVPDALLRQDGLPFGHHGRLNGPVDNERSSCLSCHSTAQVVVGASNPDGFRGVDLFPPLTCSDAQDMNWFRNVAAGTPFGVMTSGGSGCDLASPATATPPLHALDYSLQLADALESSLFFDNPNPCAELAASLQEVDAPIALPGDRAARARALTAMRQELSPERLRDLAAPKVLQLPAKVARLRSEKPTRVEIETAAKIDPAKRGPPPRSDEHRR